MVDLVDEFHSPYTFVGNNPIKSSDKDGMWEDPTTIAESMVGKYKYGNAQEYSWKISEWADKSPQLQCNQLVVVAFRKAGYGDMPRDRGGMRDWFKSNGEVYVQPWTIENKLGWRNLQRNDVVNWGSYDDNKGHIIIIVSSLVKEKMGDKEVEGYWVAEANFEKDNVTREFRPLSFFEDKAANRSTDGQEIWIGRVNFIPEQSEEPTAASN